MKYYNKKQPHITCEVIDLQVAGFGSAIGVTFVLYKFNDDKIHRVMVSREFHYAFEEIKQ